MHPWGLDRSGAPLEVHEALKALETAGIPVPAAVEESLAVQHRVEDAQPSEPDQQAIRAAYLRGADEAEISELLLADLGATRLRSEWAQARITAAAAVLKALRDSAGDVFPTLKEQAVAAIARLQAVADLGPGATLDALIRSGRNADAKLLAGAREHAADLDRLYGVRDRFLVAGGARSFTVNGFDASRWRHPVEAARHARGATAADQYVAGLREGCELWFPSPAEARAAAQALADAAAEAAEKQRKREHGTGSYAVFT